MAQNCNSCKYCWRDESVGHRECTCEDDFTEEEIIKYDEDMKDGCPHYKEETKVDDYVYMCALENVIKQGKTLKFTT